MERVYSQAHRSLVRYAEQHTTPEPAYLYELRRETYIKTLAPQMLSGHLQGQLLTMLSLMLQPQYIVEIGTFTGYATICLAAGLSASGKLITIEANRELAHISDRYIGRCPQASQIQQIIGDAKNVIQTLDSGIDMVWIDAGKKDYVYYYEQLIDKVRPGGYILADNVLWDGKVVDDSDDPVTIALQQFNRIVQEDDRVQQVLLPMRDGVTIIRKIY